jgi:hypothetical protein
MHPTTSIVIGSRHWLEISQVETRITFPILCVILSFSSYLGRLYFPFI